MALFIITYIDFTQSHFEFARPWPLFFRRGAERGATTPLVESLRVTHQAIRQGTGSLLGIHVTFHSHIVLTAIDRTESTRLCDVAGDSQSGNRAVAPIHGPHLALSIIHVIANAELRAVGPGLQTQPAALLDAKGVHAEEIARLTPSTRARLRSGAFRMLREAELIDAENRVSAPRLSGALRDLLASDPGSGLDLIPGGG